MTCLIFRLEWVKKNRLGTNGIAWPSRECPALRCLRRQANMALQSAQNFSFLWGPGTCKRVHPPGVQWSRNAPELCSDADAFYKNIVKSPQDRPIFVNQVRELNLRLHRCQPQFTF
ncbi:hypothetical protein AVEN_170009-1 [Araneus ventricosus]|uniref:Uncharacterized protein n=1 Tax=Araneus ventricosus TaxID=182803 RepID=A0A4Y2QKZ8_ARAVE|nr:hypothetical protein AVEN_170009-1 [Araneus ventricosus]